MTHPSTRSLVFLIVLAVATPAQADIGSTPAQGWRFSGSVRASARSGRTLYVGGTFDAVAPAVNDVGSFVRLGPAGTVSPQSLHLGNDALALAGDGAGGLFVARVGVVKGVTVYSVFHQLADGSIATAFQPTFNNRVDVIARVGATVYVGGAFTQANGSTRGRGAAFDLATGALLPWDPRVGPPGISAISGGNAGTVYIGGGFGDVAGVPAIGLVRLSATTGAIDALIDASIGPAGASVTKLLTVNGVMYVVGTFNVIAGSLRPGVAAIDLATQTPTAFTVNTALALVNDIAMVGGRLFIGGDFRTVNGVPRSALAELDPVTGALRPTTFQIQQISALAGAGTTLYVAGAFGRVNDASRAHIAAIDVAGGAATLLPWNPGLTDARPKALTTAGGDVAVLGVDMAWGARVRTGLAAVDLYTGDLLPFAPRLDAPAVEVLAATPASVYVVGAFASVNGVPRIKSAAVDPHGALLPWTTGAMTDVRLMQPMGPDVLVATTGGVRLLDGTTGAPRAWGLQTNGPVTALHLTGTTAYVAGGFSQVTDLANTQIRSRAGLAAADTATNQILPFAPAVAGGVVNDMDVDGSLLYVAGRFTTISGQARHYVAAVDRTSGAVAPFAPAVDQPLERVVARDGSVYLAGAFSTVNGTPRLTLAAVTEGVGATTLPFDARFRSFLAWTSLESYPEALVATTDTRIFVWSDDAVGGAPAPPTVSRVIVTGSTLSIDWQPPLIGAGPTSYVLDAALAPGAPAFASLPVSGTRFTVGGVPPGLYYLSVRAMNAAGSSVASRPIGVTVGVAGCGEPPATPELASSASTGVATLQWGAATGVATSYTLIAGLSEGTSDIGAIPSGGAFSFSSPAPAGVYYARVVASGPCGVSAPSSDVPIVVDVAAPPASPDVTAQVSGNTVSIVWTAVPGARGYRFEAGSGPLLRNLVSLPTAATSLVAPGVPPGTYFVRVIAIGTTAESSRPDEVVVIVR